MNTSISKDYTRTEAAQLSKHAQALSDLMRSIFTTLETYSNVHSGSGHNSIITTQLYEQARSIVLEYLGLNKAKYVVIFCTFRRAQGICNKLKQNEYKSLSSVSIGLPLGVYAVAVLQNALTSEIPFQTGGETAKLISREWVIWGKKPDKYEAGTPSIVNVIAFAKGLLLLQKYGLDSFQLEPSEKKAAHEILFNDTLEAYSGKELLQKLRETLIGRNIQVPTLFGDQTFVNLDNGASTPTFQAVWDAVWQSWELSSKEKKHLVNHVRSICGDMLGAPPEIYETLFTSNTTEAINLVAEILSREILPDTEPVVLNTSLEHNSNELPWRNIPGVSLLRLTVDAEGFINLQELEDILCQYNQNSNVGKKRITLVTVSGASNVLGVYNNLAEIGKIVHRYGARFMVDAAQLIAHRKVEMEICGIDYLAFSAHKVYAPFGTGVLMFRKELLNFSPEEMQHIQLYGEENSGGIAALGKALILLQRIGMDVIRNEEQHLTHYLLQKLKQIPGIAIYGTTNENSPHLLQKGGVFVFNLKGYMANSVAPKLAEHAGIGVRYGCHCAHIIVKQLLNVGPSLEAFQHQIFRLFPKLTPPGVVRVSAGIQNTMEDIDKLIKALHEINPKTAASTVPMKYSKKEFREQMDSFVSAVSNKVYTL